MFSIRPLFPVDHSQYIAYRGKIRNFKSVSIVQKQDSSVLCVALPTFNNISAAQNYKQTRFYDRDRVANDAV